MTTWHVQKGDEVEILEEDRVREQLRGNDLSGRELARPDDAEAWAPLHSYGLFREVVPHTGDPAVAADRRQLRGFVVHLAFYLVVSLILDFSVTVMAIWGVFVVGHLIRTLPALRDAVGREFALKVPANLTLPEAMSAAREPSSSGDDGADGYLRELDVALTALRDELSDALGEPGAVPDIERIQQAAEAAHARRMALLDLVDESLRRKLETDLVQVRRDAEQAPDDRTAETFEAEVRAIEERLGAMQDAAAAAERLRSRERALLHQLEGARLDLLRSGLEEQPAPDLDRRLERLRDELEAEAEVEEQLARARRASNRATM